MANNMNEVGENKMRTVQAEEFVKKLGEWEFYKHIEDRDMLDKLVSYIDNEVITYWGVVCSLFDHMVDHEAYFDRKMGVNTYGLTYQHINTIINDVMREVHNG